MEANAPPIDSNKLKSVIEQCLRQVPSSEWIHLPTVLLEKGYTRFFAFSPGEYLILDFVDDEESQRIDALIKKGYNPFPGLVKANDVPMSAAFRFEKTSAFLQGCRVNNIFSFSLGKDAALIVRDHFQNIKTNELGDYNYTLKLAYLISFGNEITYSNFYEALEKLLKESFRQWGVSIVQ